MDDDEEESELDEDELEARKAAEYFEDGDAPAGSDAAGATGGGGNSADGGGGGVPFQQLNISRPLLRAVEAMGYVNPTPVQQRAVPFALAGRCVSLWCRISLSFALASVSCHPPTRGFIPHVRVGAC